MPFDVPARTLSPGVYCSAIVTNLTEVGEPLPLNVFVSCFDSCDDQAELTARNMGPIVRKQAVASTREPDLGRVFARPSFRDMNMNGFQWVALVCPEIDNEGPNPKNLRHGQIPRPEQARR